MNIPQQEDAIRRFIDIVARLRAPNGCPWDREQTHDSIRQCLVEESAELLDAIEARDDINMVEELGDVMMQVVFHAQIAKEEGRFDIDEVARHACEKLVRRHPHVFGESTVDGGAAALAQWEKIKQGEKANADRGSAISGVPRHLPALHRAQKMLKKAAKVGFDWPDEAAAFRKVEEELAEVRQAMASGTDEQVAEEIGDLLFTIVNLARYRDLYVEDVLHQAVAKFDGRFRFMEEALASQGKSVQDCTADELMAAWKTAKGR